MSRSFDTQLLDNYDLNDLLIQNVKEVKDIIAKAEDQRIDQLSDKDFLIHLGLLRRDRAQEQAPYKLTKAALLLFGKNNAVLDLLDHFSLQYNVYDEKDKLVKQYKTGNAIYSFENIFEFYKATCQYLYDYSVKIFANLDLYNQQDQESYYQVLKQLLLNSLLHTDYSQNLPVIIEERTKYLKLQNAISNENKDFSLESDAQFVVNPLLTQVFSRIKSVDTYQKGLDDIKDRLQLLSLPMPTYTQNKSYLEITLNNPTKINDNLTSGEISVLRYLAEVKEAQFKDLLEFFSSERVARQQISDLQDMQLIERFGNSRSTAYRLTNSQDLKGDN